MPAPADVVAAADMVAAGDEHTLPRDTDEESPWPTIGASSTSSAPSTRAAARADHNIPVGGGRATGETAEHKTEEEEEEEEDGAVYAVLRLSAAHEASEKVPREIVLRGSGAHSIGRSKPAAGAVGTQINLPYVSAVHCVVSRGDDADAGSSGDDVDGVTVTDRSSKGTFVNGKKLGKGVRRALRTHDVLELSRPTAAKNQTQRLEYFVALVPRDDIPEVATPPPPPPPPEGERSGAATAPRDSGDDSAPPRPDIGTTDIVVDHLLLQPVCGTSLRARRRQMAVTRR